MRILLASANYPIQNLIQRALTRFQYEWQIAENGLDAFQELITGKFDLAILDFDLPRIKAPEILKRLKKIEKNLLPPVLVLTLSEDERDQVESERLSRVEIVSRPMVIRKFVDIVQRVLRQDTRIACLGGGTGLFTLLLGLKTLSAVSLASIVSMSDDGGSTGKLRDMFGILPPGDVRRSLTALSTAPDLLNELLQYRFARGPGLEGHNLGNLLLTALSEMRGSMSEAVRSLGEILSIQGEVIPVTETPNILKAELENGAVISGEHRIDLFEEHDQTLRITNLWQDPPTQATPSAIRAIQSAKFIILGPGDLFTSLISNLIVEGIRDAILKSSAKKIYVCNVMTKPGETTDFKASDHIREINKYLGCDVLDYVICSDSQFSYEAMKKYAKKHQSPVIETSIERIRSVTKAEMIWADLVSENELVRHDSLKLAAEIKKIMDRRPEN